MKYGPSVSGARARDGVSSVDSWNGMYSSASASTNVTFFATGSTTRDLLRKFPSFGRIASERPSHSGPLIWLPT